MKELVEAIAKALVDNPDQVRVRAIEGEQVTVFELRVHQSDFGQVIGRQVRIANAIRTILSAAGMKQQRRVVLVGNFGFNLSSGVADKMSCVPRQSRPRMISVRQFRRIR